MNSPEMLDAVVGAGSGDEGPRDVPQPGRSGKGDWAMVLTADHAAMPDPAASGGFQISTGPMQEMINERVRDARRSGDRRPDAADAGVPEPRGARGQRTHGRRRGALHADLHAGADRRAAASCRTPARRTTWSCRRRSRRRSCRTCRACRRRSDSSGSSGSGAVPRRADLGSSILWRSPRLDRVVGCRDDTAEAVEGTRSMAATDTVKAEADDAPRLSAGPRLELARIVVGDRRLRAADAARARLEVPGRPEPLGPDA